MKNGAASSSYTTKNKFLKGIRRTGKGIHESGQSISITPMTVLPNRQKQSSSHAGTGPSWTHFRCFFLREALWRGGRKEYRDGLPNRRWW